MRRRALVTVVTFGVVSLFADMVYEGARSILGPYLAILGASAAVVGLASGIGEFAGYGLRAVTGIIADRTRGYWALTIGGYVLTVAAVPLLAMVDRVDLAIALIIAERFGKAVRSPARDTLLAEAATPLGRGWGFGLHEALDQTGAVVGPLLLAAVLTVRQGDYRFAFATLAIPGVLALAALFYARRSMPPAVLDPSGSRPTMAEAVPSPSSRRYLAFVFLTTAGLAPFPLLAFHLTQRQVVSDPTVPLLFAAAMAVDALAALAAGRAYDRTGLRVLYVLPAITPLALLAFTTRSSLAWVGVIAWGVVTGIQESTLRAAVSDLVPTGRRATAYGFVNASYGIALLAAGAGIGALYATSIPLVWAVVLVLQGGAVLAIRSTLAHRD
ncbi:MAG: MFS transporter [Acidimicrobiia bacterium]|nr:MFS transporter [Acidimicrobiia bacterium]